MDYTFDTIGLIHFISAIGAMIFGIIPLMLEKGSRLHVRFGYIYVALMLILNISAFFIYKVLGTFGPFHVAAVISLLTLLGGIIPAVRKKPKKKWLEYHYEFMNWSVVGLYAAFWSETLTRFFPFSGFWIVVATATAITVAAGAYLIKSKKKQILGRFNYYADRKAA